MFNAQDLATRPQLSEIALGYVRELIMSGQLPPGSSVRPESIAELMNISSTPAREALHGLRVEGFLELVPRRGFIVAPLTGKDILDLFAVQALISGELAARAAERATPADIAYLEEVHAELIEAAKREDFEVLEGLNHKFHRYINKLADSKKMTWALGLTNKYVPRRFYASIQGWPKSTVDDHSRILDAIRSGSPDEIRKAIQMHIEHAGELLASHFDERTIAIAEAEGTGKAISAD